MGRSDKCVALFLSARHMPGLCPKDADLGEKPSAPSCPLTLGLSTEQAENQGTLSGGVASISVKIHTAPIVVNTIERIQKIHRSLYGTNFTLWAYLERFNLCLGTDTDSWHERSSFGGSYNFGDEWLQGETRGKREHEIALLPTGSQVVPITEPDCWMYSWRTQVSTRTLYYAKTDIEQGEKKTPDNS